MFKKIKKLGLGLVLVSSLILTGCGQANKDNDKANNDSVIKVGTAASWKPWSYMEGGDIQGVDRTIIEAVVEEMDGDYQLEFVVTEFQGLFGELDSGRVDFISHAISPSPQTIDKYNWTETYAYIPYYLMVRADDDSINSMEDMKGKKLALITGSGSHSYGQFWKTANDPKDEVDLIAISDNNETYIDTNKADASFYDKPGFNTVNQEGNFNLKLTGDDLFESPASFAFNKDNEDLYNKFNAALIEVKENGTLSAIYQEYFSEDYSETKTGRIRGSEGFEF